MKTYVFICDFRFALILSLFNDKNIKKQEITETITIDQNVFWQIEP